MRECPRAIGTRSSRSWRAVWKARPMAATAGPAPKMLIASGSGDDAARKPRPPADGSGEAVEDGNVKGAGMTCRCVD